MSSLEKCSKWLTLLLSKVPDWGDSAILTATVTSLFAFPTRGDAGIIEKRRQGGAIA
jgi:hypothetical protein